jgi:hypothetical protein
MGPTGIRVWTTRTLAVGTGRLAVMTFDSNLTPLPVIRSQAELAEAWRRLLSPLGFGQQSLWFMFLAASGRPIPYLTQLDETDEPPTREQVCTLAGFLRGLAGDLDQRENPGVPPSVAFLRSRPGAGRPTDRDRAWASALYAACRETGLRCEVVHLATDRAVVPLPWDAVSAAASA